MAPAAAPPNAALAAKLLARALARDHVLRGFTPLLRVSFVQATASAEAGRQRWGITHDAASRLFARSVVAASLLASFLEGEERATIQFLCVDNPHFEGQG
jgi:redox-regulated HSP33 family molecular chaperone